MKKNVFLHSTQIIWKWTQKMLVKHILSSFVKPSSQWEFSKPSFTLELYQCSDLTENKTAIWYQQLHCCKAESCLKALTYWRWVGDTATLVYQWCFLTDDRTTRSRKYVNMSIIKCICRLRVWAMSLINRYLFGLFQQNIDVFQTHELKYSELLVYSDNVGRLITCNFQ